MATYVVIPQAMIQTLNHLLPCEAEDSSEEQRRRSGGGGSWVAELVVVYVVVGVLISLCVILIIVVVCRNKARQTQQEQPVDNGHAIQRMDTAMAGAIDIPTENSIDRIPTATVSGPAIANATLTMPPALTEDIEALPVAAASPSHAVVCRFCHTPQDREANGALTNFCGNCGQPTATSTGAHPGVGTQQVNAGDPRVVNQPAQFV